MTKSNYALKWDQQYFKDYFSGKTKSLWDVEVSDSIELDFQQVRAYLHFELPIIDVGCGVGKQVGFLSEHFPKAIGIDVSKFAIRLAKQSIQRNNVQFIAGDIADKSFADEVFMDIGPSNVYMRGVLHQIEEDDLSSFISGLETICGDSGRLIFNEVSSEIRNYLESNEKGFSNLPDRMKQVFISDLPPIGLSPKSVSNLFGENWEIEACMNSHLATNILFSDGRPIQIPSILSVLKRA